uniref:Uncharacterized protein n=1 Tax=Percolomonas cosmopolitus TaxID=63605 RepID=A0A7S1KMC8_9EUKA|mmetsp:Transcript_11559/g.43397  ORF Transcript_11559/g.43397 Transcript_11559/m.43397 type:complete len:105 (+) Transcript_11559:188-502(+)
MANTIVSRFLNTSMLEKKDACVSNKEMIRNDPIRQAVSDQIRFTSEFGGFRFESRIKVENPHKNSPPPPTTTTTAAAAGQEQQQPPPSPQQHVHQQKFLKSQPP